MSAGDAPATIEVALGDRGYPIVVGRGVLDTLPDHLRLPSGVRRALVVTQEGVVRAGHVDAVERALRQLGVEVARELIPDGEPAKSADVLVQLWRRCAQLPLHRSDAIVAVGGGVVGDLAGFAAASYNRGIAVVQVPTTLLAQVDSAIGGKTGINLPEGKNLVGAFHQPAAVICDVATLASLPARIKVEGLGEVIKYGLIDDPRIIELIEATPEAAAAGDPDLLDQLVRRSAAVKARIVAADEREGGERAHLNFGHTYAHAVEALAGYGEVLHGEAVAIGTVVALRLGARIGATSQDVVARGEAVLAAVGLPTRGPRLARDAVWEVMRRDKKASSAGVRFVVLDGLGAPRVVTPDPSDVDAVLDELDHDTAPAGSPR